MALTIQSKPVLYTAAYNHQTFVISSTNSAQANFTYQCSVVVAATVASAASGSIVDELAPRPDNSRAYYNPQRTVEGYCKNEFYPTILDFQYSLNGAITKITYSIQEKYGTPPTLQGSASTGTYYVWNAAYQAPDFVDFTYTLGVKAKELTLAPSYANTISINQKYLFKSWHLGTCSTIIYEMNIVAYDAAGNATASVLRNQFSTRSNYATDYIIINVSPYGLNNYTGIISSGTPGSIIPANTVRYTMECYDNAGSPAQTTETHTVYIDEGCGRYSRYVMHFLNRLGNYDCFTFDKVSRSTAEKKDSSYKKLIFEGTNPPAYYKYSKDEVNYSTVVTNKITLNSDWITDLEAVWLKDLIMSPDVYLEDSSGVLYSVKITDKSYETKKKDTDKLTSITINAEYTLEDIRQRG